ncbi:PREDICTED: exonuclease 1-like, partial [Tinamus guttatus]|uniref:exonuclease 1-like n=1 Tax=Tinamus guttatus TaxID=94827 RepID=UPI00052EE776
LTQRRSRGWSDDVSSQKNSIWSRDYRFGSNTDTVPHKMHLPEKVTTKGTEKIISIKGLKFSGKELSAKRPRNDLEELSDGDLLSQYSFSKAKKARKESVEDCEPQKSVSAMQSIESSETPVSKESSNSLPGVRNKFASFLQRKNKERDAVVVPGTRSRFFCNATDTLDFRSKTDDGQFSQNVERDCQKEEIKHVVENVSQSSETEKPPQTTLSLPGETQKSCFQWSGSFENGSANPGPSHTALAQQLPQQQGNYVASQEDKINKMQTDSGAPCGESDEGSSPIADLECSSQSQVSCKLSESSLESSEMSPESDFSLKPADSPCTQNSPIFSAVHIEKKNMLPKTKVPGLRKSSSVGSRIVTKLKPLIPAKVSGLSKKLSPVQKRNLCDIENKVGLQATISELWKNFQFKRDYERLPSCKKSDPLSPIKDNIQLTPETEEEIFNHLERSHIQRAIFQ